jgi:8-oxo-dGTP diphosphatase
MPQRIRVVSAQIERDGRFLLTQRSAHAVLPLLWEFPGGMVHDGETDAQALRSALAKRVGVYVNVGAQLFEVIHEYTDYTVVLAVYHCICDEDPRPLKVADCRWVDPDDFGEYTFPPADEATVRRLIEAGN